MKKRCLYCKSIYNIRPSRYEESKFCSRECHDRGKIYSDGRKRISREDMKCRNCNHKVKRKTAIYCCSQCQVDWQHKQYIKRWKNGLENGISNGCDISAHIRRYLFKKHNSKCQKCGWGEKNRFTNKIPLTVSHIDGDWKNNKEENLELICPNCHSLTSTYCSLNKGFGRPRYKKIAP